MGDAGRVPGWSQLGNEVATDPSSVALQNCPPEELMGCVQCPTIETSMLLRRVEATRWSGQESSASF